MLRRSAAATREHPEAKDLWKAAAVTVIAGGIIAAGAHGAALGSPDALPGNVGQVPARPGGRGRNTVDAVGPLDPVFGNPGPNG